MTAKSVVDTNKPSTATYTVKVTKKMMQDYREQVPATEASRLGLSWTATGDIEVFSIGSDKTLYALHRDKASASGWASQRLDFENATDIYIYDVQNRYDRIFAIGKPKGRNIQIAEIVREASGKYSSRFLGLAYGERSLNIAPCGSDLVVLHAAKDAPYVADLITGYLLGKNFFSMVLNQRYLNGSKVICIPDPANRWPHLPLLNLHRGVLSAYRGTKESSVSIHDPIPRPTPDTSGNLRNVNIQIEAVALPHLPNVLDYAVAVTSETTYLLAAIDGSHILHTITGVKDPTVPGLVRWADSWGRQELTGLSRPSFSSLFMLQLPDGRLQVLMQESASGNLWITGWGGPGISVWDTAVNLGIAGTQATVNLTNNNELAFVTTSVAKGMTAWSRDESFDWHPEPVNLMNESKLEMLKTFRVGICVTNEYNASVPQLPVSVLASDDAAVIINGNSYWIGPDRPGMLVTGDTGCITITMEIANSLYAPALILKGDFLKDGRLEIRADSDTQTYLKSVTPQQLLDGRDPFTEKELLHGAHHTQKDAEAVSKTLARICEMMEHHYAETVDPPDCPVKLQPQRGVRFATGADSRPITALDRSALSREPWSFSIASGRPVFRTLGREECDAIFVAARANVGGLFGIDWGSLWESVKQGISDFVEIVVDGASTVLRFVLNGIEHALEFIVETIEQVFDLVAAVFDMVGTVLGIVVGWLLDAIGFIFGWNKIKATRDRLKDLFREMASKLPDNIPDPLTLEKHYHDKLEEMRTQIQSWLDAIRKETIGSNPFHSLIGVVPAVPDYFHMGDNVFFEQATWLVDKATAALGKLVGEFGIPEIPGMADAIQALATRADQARDALLSWSDGVWSNNLFSWITNLTSFEDGNILSLFTFVVDKVNAIVDFLQGVLHDALNLLHIARANTLAMVQWLDHTIYVPFLSAFYVQVMKNEFSILDLACLCLAIPLTITGAPFLEGQPVKDSILSMVIVWAVSYALAEGINLYLPELCGPIKIFADVAQCVAAMGLILYTDENWRNLGLVLLVIAVFDLTGRCIPIPRQVAAELSFILLGAAVVWAYVEASTYPAPVAASAIIAFVSGVVSALTPAVPEAVRRNPYVALGYGLFQGALTGIITGLYAGYRPEQEEALGTA